VATIADPTWTPVAAAAASGSSLAAPTDAGAGDAESP
jgi:hypothetical protein